MIERGGTYVLTVAGHFLWSAVLSQRVAVGSGQCCVAPGVSLGPGVFSPSSGIEEAFPCHIVPSQIDKEKDRLAVRSWISVH